MVRESLAPGASLITRHRIFSQQWLRAIRIVKLFAPMLLVITLIIPAQGGVVYSFRISGTSASRVILDSECVLHTLTLLAALSDWTAVLSADEYATVTIGPIAGSEACMSGHLIAQLVAASHTPKQISDAFVTLRVSRNDIADAHALGLALSTVPCRSLPKINAVLFVSGEGNRLRFGDGAVRAVLVPAMRE